MGRKKLTDEQRIEIVQLLWEWCGGRPVAVLELAQRAVDLCQEMADVINVSVAQSDSAARS